MPTRQRLLSLGTRRGERLVREFDETVRESRLSLGLTLTELSEIVGISRSQLSRIEHHQPPYLDFIQASRLCQVLGLDLSIKMYPTGAAIRDIAHVRLLARLCEATPAIRWNLEEVIPLPGDLRAWDAVARLDGVRIGIAAETRARGVESLLRREHAKMRDSGVDRLILLVWATRANRATLREIRESLRAELPLDSRQILAALRAGRDPGQDGILLL